MESFRTYMELHNASDVVMCRAFLLTLADAARLWFKQLKLRSIKSFSELSKAFLTNFSRGKKRLKAPAHPMNIVQRDDGLLKDYIKHFNMEALQVRKHSNKTALNAIMTGLRDKSFLFSLDKNPLTMLAKFLNRSQKHANVKESWILQDAVQKKKFCDQRAHE
ncbi:uncharacterized protein LOC131224996 [Magnolia sinica]|uniref:uncharacterized protein LOC131224996 n=1 Tax=Magnolia sinica TaxID=86752 RepID=UPI00265A9145|nr:uncharacterized protein LOC131224996 [Magnolia sinica]